MFFSETKCCDNFHFLDLSTLHMSDENNLITNLESALFCTMIVLIMTSKFVYNDIYALSLIVIIVAMIGRNNPFLLL